MVQLTTGEWLGSIEGQAAIINGLLRDNEILLARVAKLERKAPKKKPAKKRKRR